MLIFDLKKPFDTATKTHETDLHPLEEIVNIADRSMGVMMVYNIDETRISYTVISYDPASKKHITVEARTPWRAYELAQEEYRSDIQAVRLSQ